MKYQIQFTRKKKNFKMSSVESFTQHTIKALDAVSMYPSAPFILGCTVDAYPSFIMVMCCEESTCLFCLI